MNAAKRQRTRKMRQRHVRRVGQARLLRARRDDRELRQLELEVRREDAAIMAQAEVELGRLET